MPHRLMVIGAGPLQVPGIEAGRRMGLEVIATDMNPRAPGAALADRFFPVNTVNVAETVRVARECAIDAVMTLATDFPMRTVAEVAQALGLPGISPETAERATDKHLMRQALREHGAPCPPSVLVASAREAQEAAGRIGYPVIVKPTDRSGSAGVSHVAAAAEVASAFERAQAESRRGQVLVEDFVEGQEISVETMCHGGDFQVVAITDKLTTGPPYFVEMGHCVPCEFDPATRRAVCDAARAASAALGIDSGPTHTEMKVRDGQAMIIELGARLGGDRITSHLVPLATGVNLVEASIRIALGMQPDLQPTLSRAAAIRYLSAEPGTVTAVSGIEDAAGMPGVEDLAVEVAVGDVVPPIRSSGDRPGWVMAVGDRPSEAIRRAEAACRQILIATKPE